MNAYTATYNGQTFSTKGGNSNFAVVVPVVKARRIEKTERAIEITRGQIGKMAAAFGETEASRADDARFVKEIKNLEKHLVELNSVEGSVFFELESWHNEKANADKKARRSGGLVVASEKVA